MRTFGRWKNVASLNLASLLLEIEGREQEAVPVLEEVMDSELRLIGMLNLSYILMNEIRGVERDCAGGLQLLEDAVKETNEVSARAMLANALTEHTDSSEEEVGRARRLWESVQEEIEDEQELHNLRRLISSRCEKIWGAVDSSLRN
ncbi:hypothetical protein FGB62_20g14 [Gracilaria domingensis]|nr:hypothetical protein FGB62_20g14 [Gracilaria domingensis]